MSAENSISEVEFSENAWQDAYLSALAEAESGENSNWAKGCKAEALLSQIGPNILSGCPMKLAQVRDQIISEMQAWAQLQADETTKTGIFSHA